MGKKADCIGCVWYGVGCPTNDAGNCPDDRDSAAYRELNCPEICRDVLGCKTDCRN